MADITIRQEDFDGLQRAAALLQKMSNGPSKRTFEKLVKEIVPEVSTTQDIVDEAAAPYIEELRATKARMDEYIAAQEERETRAAANHADAELASTFGTMKANGLTDKGEEAVRQLMVDRNIADPHAALALFEKQNPPTSQATSSWEPDSWNLAERAVDRDIEGLFRSPDSWADAEVSNVLADLRRNAA